MEIELQAVRDFLAEHPPFDHLDEGLLDELPAHTSIRYLRRGTSIPPDDADGCYLYVIRKGAVDVYDGEQLIEKLGEGGCIDCSLQTNRETAHARTAEDTLLYLLPCAEIERLRMQSPGFSAYFTDDSGKRLRKALTAITATSPVQSSDLDTTEIAQIGNLNPVTATVDTQAHKAAQVMRDANVSALLILDDAQLVGIVTDKDLRNRLLAEGHALDTPIREIMTPAPLTMPPATSGLAALEWMTRKHIQHLPICDNGVLKGMVSISDLLRYQTTHSHFLTSEAARATNVVDLQAISARLPELQVQMVMSGATAAHVGRAVSSVTDALTIRLIELAEQQLGPAPVPYVWVAGGSQARREQSSHSDQDNALIIDDTMHDEDAAWFEQLARFVSDGLAACGFIYCPGDAMATNPKWRQTLKVWRRYFRDWIEKPEPMALMLSSIFFDLRRVHGDKALFDALRSEVNQLTSQNKIFLAYMAANALKHRPPLGFFRTFVLISDGEHDKTFDIKHRGIVPIIDLARVYALSAGIAEVNTLARLEAAAKTLAVSPDGAADLRDALEFIATLRIRHQAQQIRNGEAADNYLHPNSLSALERSHLKAAFSLISTMQEALGQRYQSGRFL
ncbi:MAG: cyclic nucleotide-binding/CBS domain-containing protein [Gammaproteobacteria bacterium]|nr:cyclic nucleotide-binding/CBS domain-containing protein [Gammaproteobacteria bacterium]MCP5136898.1 cyclic nucleotide-binding/CBS domain-containing protein [Gammaproteobacteria bacterium]